MMLYVKYSAEISSFMHSSAAVRGDTRASSSNSNSNTGPEWDSTAEFLLDYLSQIIKPSSDPV
jgi:hypothetical protein